MKGWKSARQLSQHLEANGSDVRVRTPARRNGAKARTVALVRRQQAHPEHDQQVALVRWARAQEEPIPVLKLFHAIPNGGYRSKRTAALMKLEGALSGIPDLFLPCPRWWPDGSVSHGLYIEMKAPNGRLSDRQKEIIPLLQAQEYRVVVCYSALEAAREIVKYLEIEEDQNTYAGLL